MNPNFPTIVVHCADNESVIKDVSSIRSYESAESPQEQAISLTQRRRKYALNIPIHNYAARYRWYRAFIKLKGIYLFSQIIKEINLYGTNSHVLDVYGRYRKNIAEIMEGKQKFQNEINEIVVYRYSAFMPNGSFCRYWNLFVLLLLLYVSLIMPWTMAFSDSYTIGTWFWIEACVDVCFLLDIIITLNIAYKEDNKIIADRRSIFLNYLKGFLLFDIISVCPLYIIRQSTAARSNNLIRVLRLFRFGRVLRAMKKFNFIRLINETKIMLKLSRVLRSYGGLGRLAGLIFLVVIMTHFAACMWYYVAKINELDYDTWVTREDFQDDSNTLIYIRSVYFIITVLTTVGFGDISAFTVPEMLLVTGWMIIGIAFYSVLVGTLSSVLSSLDVKVSLINSMMNEIDKFSKDFKLPAEITRRMKSQIRKESDHEAISEKERLAFIEEMPIDLKYKIAQEIYGGICNKIKLFTNQDRIFISNIIPRLDLSIYKPNVFVYYKNEFAESIYFIAQGRVNYLIGKNTVIFKTITAGAYFGEIELIEKVARKFSVKSENDSKLLIMHSQCFEYILKEYPRIGTEMIKAAERKNKKNEKAIEDIVKLNDIRMGVTENDKHRPYKNKGHKKHFTSISDTWVYFI